MRPILFNLALALAYLTAFAHAAVLAWVVGGILGILIGQGGLR